MGKDLTDLTPKKESIREKESQQIEHISNLQKLVREFLDSIIYNVDNDDYDALEQARNSLWEAFKRITGDARWSMLAVHLGDYEFAFYKMTERLVPPEVAEERDNPDKKIVIVHYSMDDLREILDEAYTFIHRSPLNFIAKQYYTYEWELAGLKSLCPWCPIQEP